MSITLKGMKVAGGLRRQTTSRDATHRLFALVYDIGCVVGDLPKVEVAARREVGHHVRNNDVHFGGGFFVLLRELNKLGLFLLERLARVQQRPELAVQLIVIEHARHGGGGPRGGRMAEVVMRLTQCPCKGPSQEMKAKNADRKKE